MSGPFYKKVQFDYSGNGHIEAYSAKQATSSSLQNHLITSVILSRLMGKLHERGLLTDADVLDVLGSDWSLDRKDVTLYEDDGMY